MFRTTSELSTLHIPVKFVSLKSAGFCAKFKASILTRLNLHLPGRNDQKYDELQKYLAEGQYHGWGK